MLDVRSPSTSLGPDCLPIDVGFRMGPSSAPGGHAPLCFASVPLKLRHSLQTSDIMLSPCEHPQAARTAGMRWAAL